MADKELSLNAFKETCETNKYKKYIFDHTNQSKYMNCELMRIHMDFNSIVVVEAPNCIGLRNQFGEFCFTDVEYILQEESNSLYRDIFHIICKEYENGTADGFTILAEKIT